MRGEFASLNDLLGWNSYSRAQALPKRPTKALAKPVGDHGPALRVAASAERYGRSAAETITFAVLINNFQFILDAQWAIVANDDFHGGHFTLRVIREIRPTTWCIANALEQMLAHTTAHSRLIQYSRRIVQRSVYCSTH